MMYICNLMITRYKADIMETPSCFSKSEQEFSKSMVLQALSGQY